MVRRARALLVAGGAAAAIAAGAGPARRSSRSRARGSSRTARCWSRRPGRGPSRGPSSSRRCSPGRARTRRGSRCGRSTGAPCPTQAPTPGTDRRQPGGGHDLQRPQAVPAGAQADLRSVVSLPKETRKCRSRRDDRVGPRDPGHAALPHVRPQAPCVTRRFRRRPRPRRPGGGRWERSPSTSACCAGGATSGCSSSARPSRRPARWPPSSPCPSRSTS